MENILYESNYRNFQNIYEKLKKQVNFDNFLNFLQSFSSCIFIGFGYKLFYSLIWILALTTIGALTSHNTYFTADSNRSLEWCFIYSFDKLIPFISLDKSHENILPEGKKAKRYFYIHQIMGYILATFLILGITKTIS